MEELRREITQYQASLIDLMKWKLIIIGSIGAVGLGLTKDVSAKTPEVSSLILCVVPFACNYVDALCKNLQLKIYRRRLSMVQIGDEIGGNAKENIAARFEFGEAHNIKEDGPIFLIFTLEEMVLTLSTATINAGLILYALLFSEMREYIIAAAMSGFLFMFYVEIIYRVHIKRIGLRCKNLRGDDVCRRAGDRRG